MSGSPFTGLPLHSAGVVLADPAWSFVTYSPKGWRKSAHAHYPCMDLAEIQALPVVDLTALDCVLVLWSTQVHLPHALAVLEAWGFTFKTMGAWAKQSNTGRCWQFGTGYLLRSAAEFFLIGTRGHPQQLSRSESDRRAGARAQPQARRDVCADRGDVARALRRAVRPLPARRLESVAGARMARPDARRSSPKQQRYTGSNAMTGFSRYLQPGSLPQEPEPAPALNAFRPLQPAGSQIPPGAVVPPEATAAAQPPPVPEATP